MNNAHRIVSSEAEELILVDAEDNVIGHRSKAACHDGAGELHRAFSLFLFNEHGELLLQQRSDEKRLWPRYWSNSICSHPRRGETMAVATARRLQDELNMQCAVEFVYKFVYQASFGDAGAENEFCHVFVGRVDSDVRPNDHEIAAIRWVATADLDREIAKSPELFTPWLKLEWQALTHTYRDSVARFMAPI